MDASHETRQILLQTKRCVSCEWTYCGPWAISSRSKHRKLVALDSEYFFTTPALLFAAAFLHQTTTMIVNCGANFASVAKTLQTDLHPRTLENLLRNAWMQFAVANFLREESMQINWDLRGLSMETWCRRVLQRTQVRFQRRWLIEHKCDLCRGGTLGVDGNAKLRTKLCANTDAGVWNCEALQAHCLTGCTNAPVPGRRYCSIHWRDAEPIFGADNLLLDTLRFAEPSQAHVSLCAVAALCKRAERALQFALRHARATRLQTRLRDSSLVV